MGAIERKKHWEGIYQTKKMTEVSWYQPVPEDSLEYIKHNNLPAHTKIIDVGGGDSFLVDYLLDLGYEDITVLDISKEALAKAQLRLGTRADKVKWIEIDITDFQPKEKYDFWHDRAAFHFLTDNEEIDRYISVAQQNINNGGNMVIGTFSVNGPLKCSGLNINQYSETSMTEKLKDYFEKIECKEVEHLTPSGTIQKFIFCFFRRLDH